MRLTITTNFPAVQRQLAALRAEVGDKALTRAVNKTAAQGQTAMSKEIRAEFNITAAKVKEKLFVRKASFNGGRIGIQAELYSKDKSGRRRAINLINFGARMTKRGLSVKIKKQGGRTIVPQGFIGNTGRTTFKRTGPKRLPIAPLQTIDVPQMFNTKRINAKVVRKIEQMFPGVFERELAFALRQFNSKG